MGEGWNERAVRLRNAEEAPERWPAKMKTGKGKGRWVVETRWLKLPLLGDGRWWRRYKDEKSARMAFESAKLKTFGPDQHRLVDPDGVIVDQFERKAE